MNMNGLTNNVEMTNVDTSTNTKEFNTMSKHDDLNLIPIQMLPIINARKTMIAAGWSPPLPKSLNTEQVGINLSPGLPLYTEQTNEAFKIELPPAKRQKNNKRGTEYNN